MKYLALFSIVSELTLSMGIVIVMYYACDNLIHPVNSSAVYVQAFNWKHFPVFFGITIFSFEGIGLALPIQRSMKHRSSFNPLIVIALLFITLLLVVFRLLDYMQYGQSAASLITRNLPLNGSLPLIIKLGLITALFFTCPLVFFPVNGLADKNFELLRNWFRKKEINDSADIPLSSNSNKINIQEPKESKKVKEPIETLADYYFRRLEEDLKESRLEAQSEYKKTFRFNNLVFHVENIFRIIIVALVCVLAASIPDFGKFLSLVGGFGGTILAFVFPCAVHLKVFWSSGSIWTKIKDILIIFFGVSAGLLTSVISIKDIINSYR